MQDCKFRIMNRKGYKLKSPVVSHGDFLKNIKSKLPVSQTG